MNDLISRSDLKKAITDATYNFEQIPIRVDKVQEIIDNAPIVEYTFEEAFQKTVCEQRLYCPERPKGEWIPVSERLPERHKAVIVTDIETSDTYQSQYIGNGYWDCDNGILKNRIIAWMPLPEPYKEAENG